MKKWFKIIGALAVIAIIAAVLIYFFVINKPHPDYEKEQAAFTLKANELFEQYRADKTGANEKYTGQVLQVSGMLDKVEALDTISIAVFIFEEGMFGDEGIRCTMLEKYSKQLQAYGLNKAINIKGYCTGYNDTDVILTHCSIVE
jgi:hypothetical protein